MHLHLQVNLDKTHVNKFGTGEMFFSLNCTPHFLGFSWKFYAFLIDLFPNQDMTPVKCIRRCQSKGFMYAGLEWANECYCGDHVSSLRSRGVSFNRVS